MKVSNAVLAALAAALVSGMVQAQAQAAESPIPTIMHKDGRYALFVDNAPFLVMGIEDLTMGDWPTCSGVWPALEYMNVNTVEIPVYWQDFEPRPGQCNYAVIDRLLAEARQHHVHLVPLWFGTYKNGSQHYMPNWMKLDPVRYPHMVDKDGNAVDSPWCH